MQVYLYFVIAMPKMTVFNIVPDDDLEQAMKKVVKDVKSNSKIMPIDKDVYQCRMNTDLAEEYTSQTKMDNLGKLLPNPIRNMITSVLSKSLTPLQITMGVLIKEK